MSTGSPIVRRWRLSRRRCPIAWWIGWVEEVPRVNSQGQARAELLDNLRDALEAASEMNRAEAP